MFILVFVYLVEAIIIGVFKTNAATSRMMSILSVIVFSFLFIALINRKKILSRYSKPLILGYLFRLFLLFFDLYGRKIYVLPNSGIDSEMFFSRAQWFCLYGNPDRGGMLARVTGTIMKLSGTDRLFPQFALMLFSIVAIIFMIYTLELFDEVDFRSKYRTVRIVCLLPNFAILSSIFLRESSVAMLLSISIFCFFKWMKNHGKIYFVLAFVFCFLAASFHSGSIGVAIGYIGVYILYDSRNKRLRVSFRRIAPTVVLVGLMAVLYTSYGGVFFSKMNNIDDISDIANTYDLGGSSYARYVGNSNSIANMAVFTIPRIIFFLLSPLPFQWRGLNDLIAFFFSSMFFAMTLFRAFRAVRKTNEIKKYIIALLIISALVVFIYAWGVSNAGTAVRHRDKLIALFGILNALAYSANINNKRRAGISKK